MITATFHPSGPASAPALTVSLDSAGHVTVTRGVTEAHHGRLPSDALARVRERIRTMQASRRPITEVGVGNAAAIVQTSPLDTQALPGPQAPPTPLLVHFQASPKSLAAMDPTAWQVPRAGDVVTVLAKVAAATIANTLATLDTGLPAAIERRGVLLRFAISGEQPQPVAVVYESGRCEAWEDVSDWTGVRVGEGETDPSTAHAAHAAVVALVDAVRASPRGMPVLGAAHDPTQRLHVAFARQGQLDEWSTVWGRASRNDAVLEPVPDDVPIALFDAAAIPLRALRDGPCRARRTTASPAPPPAPQRLSEQQLDALLASIEVPPAPVPAPSPDQDPRIPWLAELRTLLEQSTPHTLVLRAAERAPNDVRVVGCMNGDDVQLGFSPPVQLAAFVSALGIAAPLALASDTHGEWFRLVTASEGRHVHPYSAPQLGAWTVDAGTSSFYQGRAVARWLEWVLYDATSLPSATVHGLTLIDTRLGRR